MARPYVKTRQKLREERDAAKADSFKRQREIDVLKTENRELQIEVRELRAQLRAV